MNLEFIVICLVTSKAVDWILQTQWQANNKTKNFDALFSHCLIYAVTTTVLTWSILTYSFEATYMSSWIISFLGLFASHLIIDNRYIVKLIMKAKSLSWEQINSTEYGWLQIGIDQRLHEMVILIIGVIIK